MAGQYQIHNDFLHGSCVNSLLASVCTLKWHDVLWQTLRLKCVIQRFEDIKKLSMSIVCKHSSELEKDVFLSCHKSGTRKNSESPWGIEPQTFGILSSDALPLSHRDSAVSEVYYEVHMTHILHTTSTSNVNSIVFVVRNKRDGKFWAQLRNREMFFHLVRRVGQGKILSPYEESNLTPLNSALWCSTTELQRLHGEQGLLRSSCDVRPACC